MQETRGGKEIGWVGRCTAADCSFNEGLLCKARGIDVELHRDHADCNTYTNNQHEQVPRGRTVGG